MNDSSSGDGPIEVPSSETFHIYVLSFAYGALILLILVHIVWRWQWRRTQLSHLKAHYPGDKSFHCKAMRNRLQDDFENIKRHQASPETKLINTKYEPCQFGPIKEGDTVPIHWHRMKALEAATDFVKENVGYIGSPPDNTYQDPNSLALPIFVSLLRQGGGLDSMAEPETADRACELYEFARYGDGNFTESHFSELVSLLTQLRTQLNQAVSGPRTQGQRLSHDPGRLSCASLASPGSEIFIGYGKHDPLRQTTSNDPLISGSGLVFSSQSVDTAGPVKTHTKSVSVKPAATFKLSASHELAPLVKDSDSTGSLTTDTLSPSRVAFSHPESSV